MELCLEVGCGGRRRRSKRWERRRKKLLFPRSLFPDDDHLNIPLNLSEAFSSPPLLLSTLADREDGIYISKGNL